MLTGASQRVLGLCDVIIVGVMLGPVQAGIYSVCMRLARFISIPRLAIAQIAAPKVSKHASTKSWNKVRSYLLLAARISTVVVLFSLAGLYYTGQNLLSWFGPEYSAGFHTLLILCCAELIAATFGPSAQLLTMTGLQRAAFWTTLASLVLNVLTSIILISCMGIAGAAVGTIVGVLAQGITRNYIGMKVHRVRSSVI